MAPPAKRQKRLVVLGSDDEELDAKPTFKPVLTTSLAKAAQSKNRESGIATQIGPDVLRKDPAAKQTFAGQAKNSRPISSFFRAGNQAKQPDTQKPAEAVSPEVEDHEDLIVDDASVENVSDGETATWAALNDGKKRSPLAYSNAAVTNKASLQSGSQRFKIPPNASSVGIKLGAFGVAKAKPSFIDMRPWAEKYGPNTLEELMVHKRKVSDVRKWLEEALRGHGHKACSSKVTAVLQSLTVSKRLLILKGPSGAGKTATISMLAKSMDIDVTEWKNPVGSQFSSEAYLSMYAHFEDFLGRSGVFNKLALAGGNGKVPATPSRTIDVLDGTTRERIILMEEFPNTSISTSFALRSFRSSVLQHLASNTLSTGASLWKQQDGNLNTTPMVMIITETGPTTVTYASDSFTAHRLLGTELLSHPCVSTIEFNPIASTYLSKALDLVIQKEARDSGRRRVPGPAALKKLGGMGDIRSAIGSLEFLCLRGDDGDAWSGRVASRAKKRTNTSSTLTNLEKDSLALVTQRESTLGLFHAVGRVVYNKRDDSTDSGAASEPPTQPPHHLIKHVRPKTAQVSADQLINETGTDMDTFIAALHENFVLSCEGGSFLENLNGCIDALSDSDIMGSTRGDRFGSFTDRENFTIHGAPSNIPRHDEIRFQIAVRGILFSLPDPVRRRTHPIPGEGGGGSHNYKMFYPTSIKLSRQIEEIDGLVGQWADRLRASGITLGQAIERRGGHFIPLPSTQEVRPSKVIAEYQSRSDEDVSQPLRMSLWCSKKELIVEVLPYIMKIEQRGANSTQLRGLERITQFHAVTPWGSEVSDDEDFQQETPLSGWEGKVDDLAPRAKVQRVRQASKVASTLVLPVEKEVGQLYLSDDDIEDD